MPINRDPPFAGTPEVPAVQVTMGKVDLSDRKNVISKKFTSHIDFNSDPIYVYNNITFSPASASDANTPILLCMINTATKNIPITFSNQKFYFIVQSYQAGSNDAYICYKNEETKAGIAYNIPTGASFIETSEIYFPIPNSTKISLNHRKPNVYVTCSDLKFRVFSSNITSSYLFYQFATDSVEWTPPSESWIKTPKVSYTMTPNYPAVNDNDLNTYVELSVTSTTETEILRGEFSSPKQLIEFVCKLAVKTDPDGRGHLKIYLSSDGGLTFPYEIIRISNFYDTDWRLFDNLRYFSDLSADRYTHFKITLRNDYSGKTTYVRIYEISIFQYMEAKVPMNYILLTDWVDPTPWFDNDFTTSSALGVGFFNFVPIIVDLGEDYYDKNFRRSGYAGWFAIKFGIWLTNPGTMYYKLQYSSDGSTWNDYYTWSTNSTTEVIIKIVRECDYRYWRFVLKTTGSSDVGCYIKVYEWMVIA